MMTGPVDLEHRRARREALCEATATAAPAHNPNDDKPRLTLFKGGIA
jgi:hypothetical protein